MIIMHFEKELQLAVHEQISFGCCVAAAWRNDFEKDPQHLHFATICSVE